MKNPDFFDNKEFKESVVHEAVDDGFSIFLFFQSNYPNTILGKCAIKKDRKQKMN
ncbi:MAG TPA: hypothetical protein VE524_06750 [Nitrososphaeraceae archaeon]|nr:hypothetical protein [Nitrososphaeraceae archaeon]